MSEYRENLTEYLAQGLPKRMQEFLACETPTAEVKCDSSLFLRKYFLDEDGNPDRTKTSNLVLLPGYTDRYLALTGRTDRVPGLHVANAGLGGENNVMVIGWNRAKVVTKAYDIDMEQSLGRGVLRVSDDWDRQMSIHRGHTEKLQDENERIRKLAKASRELENDDSFEAHNTIGIYVVKCDAIQYDWPTLSKQMRLRMVTRGRLAVFDLGIVYGLMVFGKTQEIIARTLQKGRWNAAQEDFPEDSDSEDMSSDEEESDDGEERGTSEDTDYSMSDEPDSPASFVSDPPAKRRKFDSSHRRLYFQWRGYNTVSGAIQFDPQNRNTGYLDFANDEATVFEGIIHMDLIGGEVSFQGYRVPGMCGPLTMNWDALSHLASEKEKAPKHRW